MTTLARRKLGLTHLDEKLSAGGYTLYAPQTGDGVVNLINIYGDIVHAWVLPVRPGRHAVLLPNGNLGYNGSHEKSANLYPAWDIWHGGHFMEVTRDGTIVWEHEDIYHHHDAQWLPNGNLLYTAAAQLVTSKYALKPNTLYSDVVKEVNRKGEVVWEWKIWEHIDPRRLPSHDIFDNSHWPMINGLCQTSDELVLMSLRTTSGIIAVNKSTDEIAWHIQYPRVAQQHCPVETGKNKFLCFDNGNVRPGISTTHSRIVEFNVDYYADASPFIDKIWSYIDPMPPSFFSPYMGSVQRLWNGNTFVCESAFGRLFEITPEGEIVWEYVIPDFAEYPAPLNEFITGKHNSCFKAFRYEGVEWL
tara:strand:- start:6837 stop:7916 length:1080 start_codon:yes stop_codon:yes gene_type:complete